MPAIRHDVPCASPVADVRVQRYAVQRAHCGCAIALPVRSVPHIVEATPSVRIKCNAASALGSYSRSVESRRGCSIVQSFSSTARLAFWSSTVCRNKIKRMAETVRGCFQAPDVFILRSP